MDIPLTSWTARDGKVMPGREWPGSPRRPRAVIICVHGLSGAASDFWPVGESFPSRGYAVYAMQLRGQGNDPDLTKRGDISSSRQWRQDLLDFTALVRQRHPEVPVFWFGESLGALIVVDSLASLGPRQHLVAGMILTTPVVELRGNLRPGFWRSVGLRGLILLQPGRRLSLEDLGNSEVQVTSTTTHRGQMEHTEHYVKDFTLRLFGQIGKLIRRTGTSASRITAPALVLYTPNDVLTSLEGVEAFFAELKSVDKSKVFFPDSFHLILHDKDRSAALEAISGWLDLRTPGP